MSAVTLIRVFLLGEIIYPSIRIHMNPRGARMCEQAVPPWNANTQALCVETHPVTDPQGLRVVFCFFPHLL